MEEFINLSTMPINLAENQDTGGNNLYKHAGTSENRENVQIPEVEVEEVDITSKLSGHFQMPPYLTPEQTPDPPNNQPNPPLPAPAAATHEELQPSN